MMRAGPKSSTPPCTCGASNPKLWWHAQPVLGVGATQEPIVGNRGASQASDALFPPSGLRRINERPQGEGQHMTPMFL